jgi:RNA-directed DNA polymerase
LRRVQHLLDEGYTWVVDADLQRYFDTMPHERLMARVGERIADGRVLGLIQSYLQQGVMEGLTQYETGEYDTPQGAVISPLLANVYLHPLDQLLARQGYEMVRDADDFVLLCRTQEAAETALACVQTWVQENGLTLHPDKTRIVDVTQPGGFDFLGYHFERGYRWPRKKSLLRWKERIRELTPRQYGDTLERCIAQLNQSLRGWFGYYQHSHRTTFPSMDAYVRGRGCDHQRWPNHYYFTALGFVQSNASPSRGLSVSLRATHQLESRMRETRLSGSEGGAAHPHAPPLPLSLSPRRGRRRRIGWGENGRGSGRRRRGVPGRGCGQSRAGAQSRRSGRAARGAR